MIDRPKHPARVLGRCQPIEFKAVISGRGK